MFAEAKEPESAPVIASDDPIPAYAVERGDNRNVGAMPLTLLNGSAVTVVVGESSVVERAAGGEVKVDGAVGKPSSVTSTGTPSDVEVTTRVVSVAFQLDTVVVFDDDDIVLGTSGIEVVIELLVDVVIVTLIDVVEFTIVVLVTVVVV